MPRPRVLATAAAGIAALLTLAGCATSDAGAGTDPLPATDATSVEIEDNNGTQTIPLPLTSVVATDNRTFQTLADWGIEIAAAPRQLMPTTISYKTDESIIDLGNHSEPDLEQVVAVAPQLIINGQRFAQFHDQFVELVPDAVVLELDPREGEPLDAELKRQTTALGEIFGKQAEAKALNDALDDAIARATAAYDGSTVMAVNTSGGNIGYLAPTVGRTLGPIFDLLELEPALTVDDATDDHQGDDISVEAIAQSNPTWILVMDRDAAVAADDANYKPASDLIENSQALAGVTAVAQGNIVYMPADTYTNEGIQTYTAFLNAFADALEAAAN